MTLSMATNESMVPSVIRGVKMTKSERKLMKKHTKKICNLLKDCKGLTVSDTPTNSLFIGNGGLINGISRSQILSTFSSFGTIKNLQMIPGKSFALLTFDRPEPAIKAISEMNGISLPDCNKESNTASANVSGVTMYLCYLSLLTDNDMNISLTEYPSLTASSIDIPGLILCKEFLNEEYETALIKLFQVTNDSSSSEG